MVRKVSKLSKAKGVVKVILSICEEFNRVILDVAFIFEGFKRVILGVAFILDLKESF